MLAEFIRIWLTWVVMILGGAITAALWAARAGHFRDQERARSLALWAEVEEGEGIHSLSPPSSSPGLRPPSASGGGEESVNR